MKSARRALVTGGGSGIGLAAARALAANGIDVTVAGRNAAKLAATGFSFLEMDVTDEASVRRAMATAGPIDIFVANAGSAFTAPALKTPREEWDRMIAVNLTSCYICAQAAIPPMISRKWGRFIAVGSTASLKAYPYAGAYVAAKHGLVGWIKTLALEIAKSGVTANAICPGYTDTPLVADALKAVAAKTGRSRDDALASFVRDNPMQRLIDPDEVAAVAVFLASDGASSVNGQAIAVDGGETSS